MAGSWEIKAQKQILVGILHVDTCTIAWAFGLRNLIVPGAILPVTGMPYDMSRNVVCQKALEGGFEYCGFLDSDVIPPHDTFIRLMSHRLPIVSGVYCRRSPPHAIPVMLKPIDGQRQWVTQLPTAGLIDVELVGAGCMLIHRSVLESLPPQRPGKPWFDWRVDCQGLMPPGECLSEDFTFCTACIKMGIPVKVDCSIRCKHVGFGEADYHTFLPAEVRTIT